MNKYIKLLFQMPKENIVLTKLRERLLRMMLISSIMVGTVLYAIALIPVLQKGLYSTILLYGVLYLWIILITFLPRLPLRVRAIFWLGLIYILGSMNLFMSGFNVDAGLFLITFIAMAILLVDLQAGIVALVLSSVTVTFSGYVNISQHFTLSMGLSQTNPLLWIIGGIIFLLMGTLLIYSLTSVVHGLEKNLTKANLLAEELEQTNQSLRMSEARYRTLVETSPGLVVVFDVDGNILMANQVGLELFGYDHLEEVAGKNMMVFIAPDDRLHAAEAFQRTLKIGEQKDVEFLAIKKDGNSFIAEFSTKVVMDEAGKPLAVIGVGKDITERREAEQLLQEAKEALAEKVVETTVQLKQTAGRLDELVKYAPTVIFSFRPEERVITYISENISALLGYEASSFTEDNNFWSDHVHPDDIERISFLMAQPGNQDSSVFECRFLKKDGTYCWLRGERRLMEKPDGKPVEYVCSLSDITESKSSDEILKASEARYRNLYESMIDAYDSVDMDGRILECNPAFELMLGYSAEELHQLTYKDITPKNWHAYEAEIVKKQVLRRGFSDVYEKEYICKDGSILPVELRTKLIRDEKGDPAGMWAIIRDISERKLIEQTLRESEGQYRELLDNSMQGVIVFQDMQIVYTNDAVSEELGYSAAEIRNLSPAEIISLVHPDDRRMFHGRLTGHLNGVPPSERYSLRVIHKNGEIRWIDARTVLIELQGKQALMTTAIDVTDIKQAEAQLQESERVLRTILNAPDALVFLLDTNAVIISTNDKFAARMGKSVASLVGRHVSELLPKEVADARQIPFNQVIKSAKPVTYVDSREGVWFENSLYPILDEFGKVTSVAIYARDITEQRRVTEALRASEEQYRKLTEASHDMIFIIDRQDCIEYINSFGANLLGHEAQEMIGQPRARFFPSETSGRQEPSIKWVLRTGEALSAESINVFHEQTIWLNTWMVPLKDASGQITSVLGVARDITGRKRVEEDLRETRNQLDERVLVRTRELLATQEKLRILTAQTIAAQEEERRAISRELHDEAGQALITLKYGLAAIQSELPEKETLGRQRLSDLMNIIDQTMTHIRALAHSLRPPVLEVGGIDLSLQDYCQELSRRTQIPVYYQGQDIPGLPDEIGISLYRFVQEALTNILKHAHATEVKVRLQLRKGEITLSVSDNGRGMKDGTQTGGLGLLGINERLNLLGGKLEIKSQKGRGSRLVARVPSEKVAVQ